MPFNKLKSTQKNEFAWHRFAITVPGYKVNRLLDYFITFMIKGKLETTILKRSLSFDAYNISPWFNLSFGSKYKVMY